MPNTHVRTERELNRAVRTAIIVGVAIVAIVWGIVGLGKVLGHQSPPFMLADPNAIAGNPAYYGAVSLIGTMGWAAAVVSSLFAAVITADSDRRRFYIGGVVVLAILGIDDTYMLHEYGLPGLGIPEKAVLGVYAVVGIAWLFTSLKVLRDGRWIGLFIGLAAMGVSVGVDQVMSHGNVSALLEDTFKELGIWLLVAHFFRTAVDEARALRTGSTSVASVEPTAHATTI